MTTRYLSFYSSLHYQLQNVMLNQEALAISLGFNGIIDVIIDHRTCVSQKDISIYINFVTGKKDEYLFPGNCDFNTLELFLYIEANIFPSLCKHVVQYVHIYYRSIYTIYYFGLKRN